MTFTILSDNNPNQNNTSLQYEHGLSMLIEFEDKRILCDFGESSIFDQNAAELGIDLDKLDFAFISHAHRDHTGGLQHFLNSYQTNIIASREIFSHKYFSTRNSLSKRDISTSADLLIKYPSRFNFINDSQWITNNIAVIKCKDASFPTPSGNVHLFKDNVLDNFSHELSLAFVTKNGLVIVSSCTHCGMMNIAKECMKFTKQNNVMAFVGGLHLVDNSQCKMESANLASLITNHFPNIKIFTGHCTCSTATNILSENDVNTDVFHVGKSIAL